ncbi:MAG: hypothetical protein ACOVT5_05345 [Armatimonadaceae bacterium]
MLSPSDGATALPLTTEIHTMRTVFTAILLLAGLSAAHAQSITPGLGGVALTGQRGAGVVIPWDGSGLVVGAPGVGSYNLGTGAYTSPLGLRQMNDPTAFNFNTGAFNTPGGLFRRNAVPFGGNDFDVPMLNGIGVPNGGLQNLRNRGTAFESGFGGGLPAQGIPGGVRGRLRNR